MHTDKRAVRGRHLLLAISLLWLCASAAPRATHATPVPCLVCGSTPLVADGVDATISFAVISGLDFSTEVGSHAIGFLGSIASGTLGPGVVPPPGEFVYLYQLVNDGGSVDPITSLTLTGAGIDGGITGGTRLESTIFVDPALGLVSAGPAGATTALSAGPTVEFENGLGDPTPGLPVPTWSPCLGSGPGAPGVLCSDAAADLFPASVVVHGWGETPSTIDLDPSWSGSIVWFSSPFGPTPGTASITEAGGAFASGSVPVPIPEPSALMLMLTGAATLGASARRR